MKYILLLFIPFTLLAQDKALIAEARKLESGIDYLYREYLKSIGDERYNNPNMALIYNKEMDQKAYDKMKEISEAMKKDREEKKTNKIRTKSNLIKKLGQLGLTKEELEHLGL